MTTTLKTTIVAPCPRRIFRRAGSSMRGACLPSIRLFNVTFADGFRYGKTCLGADKGGWRLNTG